MRYTHLGKSDLNLLLTFQALVEERSITHAAHRMFLSEPAMSRAFHRVQELLKDEVLVRTSRGYQPTKRALSAYRELIGILPRLDHLLRGREFVPTEATDHFRIAAGPYASVWLLPRIVESVIQQAPHVQLDVSALEYGFQKLETSEVDLMLTGNDVPRELRSTILIQEPWVCVVRQDHSLTKGRMTLHRYLAAAHVSGRQGLLDQQLNRLGYRRQMRAQVIDFFPMGVIVERTDLIATLPLRTARQLTKLTQTKILRAPFDLTFTYFLVWHPRNDSEAGHKWLRQVIQKAASKT